MKVCHRKFIFKVLFDKSALKIVLEMADNSATNGNECECT